MLTEVALWKFPPEDFEAWVELTGNDFTLDEYRETLDRTASDLRNDGIIVVWVPWSVEKMIDELSERGLENTTENRAMLIGEAGSEREQN